MTLVYILDAYSSFSDLSLTIEYKSPPFQYEFDGIALVKNMTRLSYPSCDLDAILQLEIPHPARADCAEQR